MGNIADGDTSSPVPKRWNIGDNCSAIGGSPVFINDNHSIRNQGLGTKFSGINNLGIA